MRDDVIVDCVRRLFLIVEERDVCQPFGTGEGRRFAPASIQRREDAGINQNRISVAGWIEAVGHHDVRFHLQHALDIHFGATADGDQFIIVDAFAYRWRVDEGKRIQPDEIIHQTEIAQRRQLRGRHRDNVGGGHVDKLRIIGEVSGGGCRRAALRQHVGERVGTVEGIGHGDNFIMIEVLNGEVLGILHINFVREVIDFGIVIADTSISQVALLCGARHPTQHAHQPDYQHDCP